MLSSQVAKHSLTPHISAEEESRMRRLATVSPAQLNSQDVKNFSLNSHFNHVTKNSLTNGTADVDEDDDLCLADVKKNKKLSGIFEAKKREHLIANKKPKKVKDSRDKNKTSKSSHSKPSGMDLFLKKMGKPLVKNRIKSGKNNDQTQTIVINDDDDDRPLSAHLNASLKNLSKSSSRKSSTPRKKKQATLLELTKKGGGIKLLASPSPAKHTPSSKPRKPRQPLIVVHLLSLKREKKFRVHKYKITVAA